MLQLPMNPKTAILVGHVFLLFAVVVIVPSIVAAIGYAAWKGKPKDFSREMYWTAFVVAILSSLFVLVYAQRMHADVRTSRYLVQVACFCGGALLFGVAGGCMVGILAYRRHPGTEHVPK